MDTFLSMIILIEQVIETSQCYLGFTYNVKYCSALFALQLYNYLKEGCFIQLVAGTTDWYRDGQLRGLPSVSLSLWKCVLETIPK